MKIRYFFFSLSCLMFASDIPLFASQTSPTDSAQTLLKNVQGHIQTRQMDLARLSALHLLKYSQDNNLANFEAEAYYALGYVFSNLQNVDSALVFLNKADSIFGQLKNERMQGKAKTHIADLHKRQNEFDYAIQNYNSALDCFSSLKDTLWMGIINNHLGHIHLTKGDYYQSLKHFQDAVVSFSQLEKCVYVGAAHIAMGAIYRKTKDTANEKQAYQNAIEVLQKEAATAHLGEAYNNLAEIYLKENNTENGFELLEQAKTIYDSTGHGIGMYSYYAVLANYYSDKTNPDYAKVIDYGTMSADIAFEHQRYREYADQASFVGNAYLKINKLEKAKDILSKGYEIAEKFKFTSELSQLSYALSELYTQFGNTEKSHQYLKEYVVLKDSLATDEKVKEFTSLDLTFKHKQEQYRDSLIQVQQKTALIYKHEKELKIQHLRQLILALVLIAIAIFVVFIVIAARNRKAQNTVLDEKNKLINQSLHEKELLLKEIHHRVQNNFQTISSLLQLQSKGVEDKRAKQNITEGQRRIQSMALIHQRLYQNNDLSTVNMQDYIEQLSGQIIGSYSLKNLKIQVDAQQINLDIDTSIPLGLILNELITNSCKYAFDDNKEGLLEISLSQSSTGNYELIHKDSGPGLPDGIDPSKLKSLGLRLISRLADQLHGNLEYSYEDGAWFKIAFLNREQRSEM